MKAVIQRVKKCAVRREDELVSSIGPGCVVLVCFKRTEAVDLDKAAKKMLEMRLFDSWTKSLEEMEFELMILSQFTLYAQLKGRKPSFHLAEERSLAKSLFTEFIARLKRRYCAEKVKSGIFGAKLEIEATLDGPCTIVYEL